MNSGRNPGTFYLTDMEAYARKLFEKEDPGVNYEEAMEAMKAEMETFKAKLQEAAIDNAQVHNKRKRSPQSRRIKQRNRHKKESCKL